MSILDFIPPSEKELVVSSSSRRKGVMLCYPLEEKRLLRWNPPFFVQPKLDGERCRQLEGNLLVSSECNPIISLPHIVRALQILESRIAGSALAGSLLDGELYLHGWSFEKIHSCVSRHVNPHPEAHKIQFHVFDFWNSSLPQYERTSGLLKIQKHFPPELVLVPTKLCSSLDEILAANDAFVSEGYEGIIVREPTNLYVSREESAYRSPFVMKFKPKKNDTYKIIGVVEAVSESGSPKGFVGAFVCCDDSGSDFSVACGKGCTEEVKTRWWKNREELVGKTLYVEYQALTADRRVPRFGRCPLKFNKHLEVL